MPTEEPIKPRKAMDPKELTPEQRQWKIRSLEEHLAQLEEALWYAKQDAAKFVLSMDIQNAEKRQEAERAVADSEKEMSLLKEQISLLRAV